MKRMTQTLTTCCAALMLSLAYASAETLLEENWEGLSAGANVMQSGRWTMAQGLPSEMGLVSCPEGLSLNSTVGKARPIAVSKDRFALDSRGVEMSVRFLQSADIGEEEQFQFGFRGADSSGAPLRDSYRVRVLSNQVVVNRFPRSGKGKQQVIGTYNAPGSVGGDGEECVVTFRLKPISEEELGVEVAVNGVHAFRVVSRMGEKDGVPALGSMVRAFFLSGPGTFIREISVKTAQ